MNNTAQDTYENRCKGRVGEDVFEDYCTRKGVQFYRTGFDEKQDQIKKFWMIHPTMRHIPDYLIENDKGQLSWIHVKGTPRLKLIDLFIYSQFDQQFKGECGFFLAFCFKGQDPRFLTFPALQKKLTGLTVQEWDDGKQYVHLPL